MAKKKRQSQREMIKELEISKEARERVFNELLMHVRAGYSLESFSELSKESVYEYLKTYPNEFVWEDLDKSIRAGMREWETIGRKQAEGTCLGNSRSWIYNMMNKFGWTDKSKVETCGTQAVNVQIVSYESVKPT